MREERRESVVEAAHAPRTAAAVGAVRRPVDRCTLSPRWLACSWLQRERDATAKWEDPREAALMWLPVSASSFLGENHKQQ